MKSAKQFYVSSLATLRLTAVILIISLISVKGYAQLPLPIDSIIPIVVPTTNKVIFRYDTTVLFVGIDTTAHVCVFAVEKKVLPSPVCTTIHGDVGCPDLWLNQKRICTICLRHLLIKEDREIEQIPDPYQQALSRLNKLLK